MAAILTRRRANEGGSSLGSPQFHLISETKMAVYVVTWNLNKEGAAYDTARATFLKHLGKYDNTQDAGLETARWISTSETARQVSDYLRQKLDANDRLFVSLVSSGTHSGWLETSVWTWIDARA